MKKLLYALAFTIGAASAVQAAPGDSTWVQATNRRFDRGNGYGAYDTTVAFPSGSVSYRKIYMIFTLGKYACPGYDPNNPGERPGQTGWCGDWDYTVMNYLMTPAGDTLELGRFITPYANSRWPRTPLNWTQNYVYDVTDYYPLLKNNAAFRVFYSGYSAGFTGDVKFLFIKGTPERNVLRIDRLWKGGGYDYGRTTSINDALMPLSFTAPAGTQSSVVKLNITGHGGDSKGGCAEFCPNTFMLALNGNTIATQQLFRDNCSENNLYPQSGTWIYARANWCPGALVNTFSYPLSGVTGGSAYQLGLRFPAYVSTGSNQASYIINGAVINYGALNKKLDAEVTDIIAPTDDANHFRQNPTSSNPIITVHNSGSSAITSIRLEYGVEGRMANTYTWNGTLTSLESRDLSLPALNQLMLNDGIYGFYVRILDVNGQADEDANNNVLRSRFTAAPVWPADIRIQLAANESAKSGSISETGWRLLDAKGNVVAEKQDCGVKSLCSSTLHLADGAYKLVVTDSAYGGYYDIPTNGGTGVYMTGDGLLPDPDRGITAGSLTVYDTLSRLPMALSGYFDGNFGAGFTQSFYVGSPLAISKATLSSIRLSAVPNPATNSFAVKAEGNGSREGTIRVVDVTGREVIRQSYRYGFELINSEALQSGIYLIQYEGNDGSTAHQRVVISH